MSQKPNDPNQATETVSKEERLSSALRENLKRRKAQSRQRAGETAPSASQAPTDPAAERPEKDKN